MGTSLAFASMWTDILIRPALFPPGGKGKERLFSFAYLFWACMAPNGIKLSHEYDGQQPPPKNIPPFWVFFDVGFPRTPFRCKVAISILLGKRRSYQDWRSDGSGGEGDGMKKSFDFLAACGKGEEEEEIPIA